METNGTLNRIDKLLRHVDRSMRVLEIGPSYSPTAPKAAGWQSFVLDHASQAELREKYASLGVPTVWHDGPIETAVPEHMHGSFDACIASHVIEHVPDPISLFHSLDRLLAADGVVSLAVPDKRFCFDFFRPLTLTPAWIEAFERKATRHSKRALRECQAYMAHNGELVAWGNEAEIALRLVADITAMKHVVDAVEPPDLSPYVDCHAWCFTPSSFELLFLELAALGLVNFRISDSFPTVGCEFFVTLRKGQPELAVPAQDRRLQLLRAIAGELAEQDACLRPKSPPKRRGRLARVSHSIQRRLRAFRRGEKPKS
jgi:SAM-dependent methyltransferase